MKILFISTNDAVPWGGSEELWSGAAMRLAAQGNEVMASVWDHVPEPAALDRLRKGGVIVHKRYQRPIRRNRLQQAFVTMLHGAPATTESNELEAVDRMRPDFVVFSLGYQWDPKFVRISKVLRERGIRYGVVVQLVIEGLALSDDHCTGFLAAYGGAAKVWFVSDQNRSITARELAHRFTNTSVVDNPVDLDVVQPGFPANTGPMRLAVVGRLTPYHKGHDLLLEMLALDKWRSRPLEVTFYGEGSSEEMLRRAIDMWGLKSVEIAGHEPDKQVIWSTHHAALFASRMEGRSLALQEAMAHGRMVISTDVGGARDLITDGGTGFLVPFPTAEALDRTMEAAWEARSTWEHMGQQARSRILSFVLADPIGRFAEEIRRTSAEQR